jgi:hypothetical protein
MRILHNRNGPPFRIALALALGTGLKAATGEQTST